MRAAVRLRAIVFAVFALFSAAVGSASPITLEFNPASDAITPGGIVDIAIVVSGLNPRPPSIGAWDLTIAYDPAILSISDWIFGDKLGTPSQRIDGAVAGNGDLELAQVSLLTPAQLDALQTPSFTLATVQFTGLVRGTSAIRFTSVRVDDAQGNKFDAESSAASITVQTPEPACGLLVAFGLIIAVGIRRRAGILIAAVLAAMPAALTAQVARPAQRVCISVYRYGGEASGWRLGGADFFPSGTAKDIIAHLERARQVFQNPFTAPGVDWVYEPSFIIEDLPDFFGNHDGDIDWVGGAPSDENDRIPKPSEGGTTGSPDIDRILKDIADAECYPVVFVKGGLGSAGLTIAEPTTCRFGGQNFGCQLGVVSIISSNSFPKRENPNTKRVESQISTLAHEFGHSTCLDPIAPDGVPKWGDATGHPPHPQGINGRPPNTPEGAGFLVPLGPADAGKTLRFDVMWFTGTERSGDETFTARQANVSNVCAGFLRSVNSPSFSVTAGGVTGLDGRLIYYAPATPPNRRPTKPVSFILGVDIDGLSYGEIPPGRFPLKFSVDMMSNGLPGTAVAGLGALRATTEFAAPLGVTTRTNIPIIGTTQFGLAIGDQIDALEPRPPSSVDPSFTGFVTPPNNTTFRVYFSVAPNVNNLDPGTIYVGTAKNANGVITRTLDAFAGLADLNLRPGDDIGGLCVSDTDGKFDPTDKVYFTLKRNSPTLARFGLSSADVFSGVPNGFFLAYTSDQLGLLPTDQISGLKCFAATLCDIDGDGKVNSTDIQAIFDARSLTAVPGDPRDVDGDGLITVNDARICANHCDKENCQ